MDEGVATRDYLESHRPRHWCKMDKISVLIGMLEILVDILVLQWTPFPTILVPGLPLLYCLRDIWKRGLKIFADCHVMVLVPRPRN